VRILFAFFGTRPHLYPLVPLAWAFRAAGHDVRLASTPMWATEMAYSGLPTITVGGSPDVSSFARDELAGTMFTQQSWPVDWAADVSRPSGPRFFNKKPAFGSISLSATCVAPVPFLLSRTGWPKACRTTKPLAAQ